MAATTRLNKSVHSVNSVTKFLDYQHLLNGFYRSTTWVRQSTGGIYIQQNRTEQTVQHGVSLSVREVTKTQTFPTKL